MESEGRGNPQRAGVVEGKAVGTPVALKKLQSGVSGLVRDAQYDKWSDRRMLSSGGVV